MTRSLYQYQRDCHAAICGVAGGSRPPEPETDAEIAWLAANYTDWARDLGYGPFVPLPDEWRARFVATLQADADFRAAVASWIGGAA